MPAPFHFAGAGHDLFVRFFLTALVAAVLVGTAGATTSTSGLRGLVTRGPITPVCAAEQPCTAPATGVTLTFWSSGHVVGRATTNANGWYRISLRPGTYGVGMASQSSLRRLTPVRAAVSPDRYRRVDFSIDTGIR